MEITINGKKTQIPEKSLTDIIRLYKINPNNCIVELNGKFVKKESLSYTEIRDGDRLELIRFIGGG